MPNETQINELQIGIKEAVESENWTQVDHLQTDLNILKERDAASICEHAYAVEQANDLPRAATMLRRAIRLEPENSRAMLQLGSVYLSLKRISEAEKMFRSILEIEPDNVSGTRYLVQCLQDNDRDRAEAEARLKHVLGIDPENAAIWIQLGAILANDDKRFDEAEEAFRKGLELAPMAPSAYHNYGIIKRLRGDLEESKELLEHANKLMPSDTDYAFSLMLCHLFREDLDSALEWVNQSIKYDPENNAAQVYLAFILFLQGKMREGWTQYESRLKLSEFKNLNFGRPRWEGEDLNGETVLVLREQGMGDNIQFIRYAQQVAERGGEVVVYTWEHLSELFRSVEGVTTVTTAIPAPKYFHRFTPLLSLPYTLETDESNIPCEVPYMKAPDADISTWAEKLSSYSGLLVGLVWRGNPLLVNDRFRSAPLRDMCHLLTVPGVTFFSLMKERDVDTEPLPDGLNELGHEFDNFTDTAAAIQNLDLVISVDTSVCHLAGALARPVWTLLAKGPDFRWGLTGETTPWYPTMKLYRQTQLGIWDDVLDRIRNDLQDLVATN